VADTPKPAQPAKSAQAKLGLVRGFAWLAVFGIGSALGAILGAAGVAGWIIGLVVSAVTVLLGFFLRRSLEA
jgi:hypothetical protein